MGDWADEQEDNYFDRLADWALAEAERVKSRTMLRARQRKTKKPEKEKTDGR